MCTGVRAFFEDDELDELELELDELELELELESLSFPSSDSFKKKSSCSASIAASPCAAMSAPPSFSSPSAADAAKFALTNFRSLARSFVACSVSPSFTNTLTYFSPLGKFITYSKSSFTCQFV